MAIQFHHRLCRRYRPTECRLEDLDLDAAFLRGCSTICVFHVP